MFHINNNDVLQELRRANITEKEFLDDIATHKEDTLIIFYNDTDTDDKLITYDTYHYRQFLKKKNLKVGCKK